MENNISNLQIFTKGKTEIVGGLEAAKANLEAIQKHYGNLITPEMKSKKDYKEGFKDSKIIKKGQEKFKEIIERLDNPEILEFKKLIFETSKIMGAHNGIIKKRLEEYKQKEIAKILEITFENVESRTDFPRNWEVFAKECLNQFKGKAKFEEMQNISVEIAEKYNNQLELQQIKCDALFNELKLTTKEMGLIKSDDDLKVNCKNIICYSHTKEKILAKYMEEKKIQEVAFDKKLQEEENKKKNALESNEDFKKIKLGTIKETVAEPNLDMGAWENVEEKKSSKPFFQLKIKKDIEKLRYVANLINKISFEKEEAKEIKNTIISIINDFFEKHKPEMVKYEVDF